MGPMISLKGIDEATRYLPRSKRGSLRFELLGAIRKHYNNDEDLERIKEIPIESLINEIWDVEDDSTDIKEKRRKFSNLKSSLNQSFKKLSEKDKNLEGIKIGRKNIFVISDDRKNELIEKLAVNMKENESLQDMIAAFRQVLSEVNPEIGSGDFQAALEELDKTKKMIKDLSGQSEREDQGTVTVEGEGSFDPGQGTVDTAGVGEVKGREDADTIEPAEDIKEAAGVIESVEFNEDTGRERTSGEIFGHNDIGIDEGEDSDMMEFLSEEIPPDEDLRKDELLWAKVLAERFEEYLDVTKRFYNRHIWIPGNDYIIGSKNPGRNEQSEARVSLRPFYLGEYPVTNAIFKVFVEKTGHQTSAEKAGYGEVYEGGTKRIVDKDTGRKSYVMTKGTVCKTVEGACWRHPYGPGSSTDGKENHPVVQISIDDARAFAAWTGKRLPSEAEWEAAARSADGSVFPWGNQWKSECCNLEDTCFADTTPVDYYKDLSRSSLGICDLSGNILEWTSTIGDGLSGNGTSSGERYYVIKGGSFIHVGIFSPSMRLKASEKSWSNITGFRCAV